MSDFSRFLPFSLRPRTPSVEPLAAFSDENDNHADNRSRQKSSPHRQRPRTLPKVVSFLGLGHRDSGRDSRQSHRATPSPPLPPPVVPVSLLPPPPPSPPRPDPTIREVLSSSSPTPTQTPNFTPSASPSPEVPREMDSPEPPSLVLPTPVVPSPVVPSTVVSSPVVPPTNAIPKILQPAAREETPVVDRIPSEDPSRVLPADRWYRQDFLQRVEAVQIVMMTNRGATRPLPVEYNPNILIMLEGVENLLRHLTETKTELAEQRNLREKELEQFRDISEDWIQREKDYKAEVKRLELTLAKESRDGMACVALTRQGSLVDRASSKRFQERLKRLSNHTEDDIILDEPSVIAETISGGPLISNLDSSIEELVRSATKRARERDKKEEEPLISHYIVEFPIEPIPRFITPNNDALVNEILARERARCSLAHHNDQTMDSSQNLGGPSTSTSSRANPSNSTAAASDLAGPPSKSEPAIVIPLAPVQPGRDDRKAPTPAPTPAAYRLEAPLASPPGSGSDVRRPKRRKARRSSQLKPYSENQSTVATESIERGDMGRVDVTRARENQAPSRSPRQPQRDYANEGDRGVPVGASGLKPTADDDPASVQARSGKPSRSLPFTSSAKDYFPHEPSPQPRVQRRRGFSFSEGEDEVLALSPTFYHLNQTKPSQRKAEATAAPIVDRGKRENGPKPGSDRGARAAEQVETCPSSSPPPLGSKEGVELAERNLRGGWSGQRPYEHDSVSAHISDSTFLPAMVTPSNSTGSVIYVGNTDDSRPKNLAPCQEPQDAQEATRTLSNVVSYQSTTYPAVEVLASAPRSNAGGDRYSKSPTTHNTPCTTLTPETAGRPHPGKCPQPKGGSTHSSSDDGVAHVDREMVKEARCCSTFSDSSTLAASPMESAVPEVTALRGPDPSGTAEVAARIAAARATTARGMNPARQ